MGAKTTDDIIKSPLFWDVLDGFARRFWTRNKNSIETSIEFNQNYAGLGILLFYIYQKKSWLMKLYTRSCCLISNLMLYKTFFENTNSKAF